MLSVVGKFQNGVAQPAEPVTGRDGQSVIITFLGDPGSESGSQAYDPGQDSLMQLIEACRMETGIGDLAHQHDHYLHGHPKRP